MIVGHKVILNNLKNSVLEDRISQSYLFSGAKGIGKKTVADFFVRMIMCKEENSPCGLCESCLKLKTNSHPDVSYITVPQSKKSIGADDIRTIINEAYIKPYSADKKIFVIHPAGLMTERAQNVILKILEEPPSYIVFILIADNMSKMIDTIVSRSQVVKFNPNTKGEVLEFIRLNYNKTDLDSNFIAEYSGGLIGKAIALVEDNDFKSIKDGLYKKLANVCMKSQKSNAYELMDFIANNKDNIKTVTELMLMWYRDCLTYKIRSVGDMLIINKDKLPDILGFAEKVSEKGIIAAMGAVLDASKKLDRYANFNITVLNLCLKLSEI